MSFSSSSDQTPIIYFFLIFFLLGAWVSYLHLKSIIVVPLSLIKFLIPTIYFPFFYNNNWNFGDDIMYAKTAGYMINAGFTPFNVFVNYDTLQRLIYYSGSPQFFYPYFNFLLQYLTGVYDYYPAIYTNIFFTFLCALYLDKILQILKFDILYRKMACIFFLLHWEILVWSSLLNLKDITVMLLSCISLYQLLVFSISKKKSSLVYFGICTFLLSGIRIFTPFIIVFTWGLWMIKNSKSVIVWLLAGIIIITMLAFIPLDTAILSQFNPKRLPMGLIRFLLTPQPWATTDNYTFLIIPSLLNITFMIPMIIGMIKYWQVSREAKLLVMYFLITCVLYAFLPASASGPRQRVQFIFIYSLFQFHFLWMCLSKIDLQILKYKPQP